MEVVTRVNITDPVTLKRLSVAQRELGDKSATKTADRLINEKLNDMGIPLIGESEPKPQEQTPHTPAA